MHPMLQPRIQFFFLFYSGEESQLGGAQSQLEELGCEIQERLYEPGEWRKFLPGEP